MAREPIPPAPEPYPGSAQPVGPGAPPPERRRGPWWIGIVGAIIGIVGVLLVFWVIDIVAGDDGEDGEAGQTLPSVTAPADVFTVQTVMSNAEEYLGQELTVGGTLSAAVSPGLAYFGGAVYDTENLLLLTGEPAPGTFPTSATARATGTLTRLNITEVEEALGVDLDDELLSDFEGDVALLAESVHYFISGDFGAVNLIDLEGQEVTFAGSVDEVLSERAFRAEDVVVIAEEGLEFDASEDAAVRAHGVAGVVTEDLDPGLSNALTEEQIDEYLGHAMLIADSVEFIE